MAEITGGQRRLVASSIAFGLAAVLMMPMAADARGGAGGGHGARNGGAFGFPSPHANLSHRIVVTRRNFSHRRVASRRSQVIGYPFFGFGTDGGWADNSSNSPVLVVTQEPIMQQAPAVRPARVKTPSAAQDGIIVVRGGSKSYVTFANGAAG